MLKEDDVLFHPLQHVVLAPDVREPRLDVVGEVHVDAAPGQQPENPDELHGDEEEAEHELQDERQVVPEQRRGTQQREDR